MRRAAKKDRNHPEIVAALRKVGCNVLDLGAVGKGCPDLLVERGTVMWLMEVKDGKRPPSERKLTPDQVEFHQKWGRVVFVVTSVEEAIKTVDLLA